MLHHLGYDVDVALDGIAALGMIAAKAAAPAAQEQAESRVLSTGPLVRAAGIGGGAGVAPVARVPAAGRQ